uniref:Uncharacterized protein n=1 Tax=Oryza brachyantha TaxID=4533 RepID=J3M6N5_ORYBR
MLKSSISIFNVSLSSLMLSSTSSFLSSSSRRRPSLSLVLTEFLRRFWLAYLCAHILSPYLMTPATNNKAAGITSQIVCY